MEQDRPDAAPQPRRATPAKRSARTSKAGAAPADSGSTPAARDPESADPGTQAPPPSGERAASPTGAPASGRDVNSPRDAGGQRGAPGPQGRRKSVPPPVLFQPPVRGGTQRDRSSTDPEPADDDAPESAARRPAQRTARSTGTGAAPDRQLSTSARKAPARKAAARKAPAKKAARKQADPAADSPAAQVGGQGGEAVRPAPAPRQPESAPAAAGEGASAETTAPAKAANAANAAKATNAGGRGAATTAGAPTRATPDRPATTGGTPTSKARTRKTTGAANRPAAGKRPTGEQQPSVRERPAPEDPTTSKQAATSKQATTGRQVRTPQAVSPSGPAVPLWRILREHPAQAPEMLALTAVRRIGPAAARWAADLRQTYPTATGDGLARLALRRSARTAAVGTVLASRIGLLAPAAELVGLAWHQAEVVLRVAAAYGHDPAHVDRAVDLLAITRIHPDADAARAALADAYRRLADRRADPAGNGSGDAAGVAWPEIVTAVLRLAAPLTAPTRGWGALRAAAAAVIRVPGLRPLLIGASAAAGTQRLGDRAVLYFRGANTTRGGASTPGGGASTTASATNTTGGAANTTRGATHTTGSG